MEAIHEEQKQFLWILLAGSCKLVVNLPNGDFKVFWTDVSILSCPQRFHDYTKFFCHFTLMPQQIWPVQVKLPKIKEKYFKVMVGSWYQHKTTCITHKGITHLQAWIKHIWTWLCCGPPTCFLILAASPAPHTHQQAAVKDGSCNPDSVCHLVHPLWPELR